MYNFVHFFNAIASYLNIVSFLIFLLLLDLLVKVANNVEWRLILYKSHFLQKKPVCIRQTVLEWHY